MAHFELPSWVRHDPAHEAWLLDLHVQPGARTSEACGEHDGRLKLKIAAPPVDNKANGVLRSWVAACLGVPNSAVRLLRGEASRRKTLAVSGLDPERIAAALERLINNKS
ncbi:MAG: DUF167 domain-containing protein [Thiobacillus sp.]